jgi:uncharacterized protein (TIGR02231 family)
MSFSLLTLLRQRDFKERDMRLKRMTGGAGPRAKLATAAVIAFALAAPLATASSALAAELAAGSRIASVTVYPSGAEVARTAKVSLPAGSTTLIFRDLPTDIRTETIRIEGVSTGDIIVGSVETARQTLTEAERSAMAAEGQDLRDKIKAEKKNLAALVAQIGVKETQKRFLENLATLPTNPGIGARGAGAAGGTDWAQMFELIGTNLAAVQTDILEFETLKSETEKTIADLEKQLDRVAVRPREALVGRVAIESAAANEAEFTLRYAVRNASWTPLYDARLTTTTEGGKPTLKLVRRAAVRQSTSEAWTDVALTLSTVRPGGRTSAPSVNPVSVDFAPPPRPAATVAASPPQVQFEALQDSSRRQRMSRGYASRGAGTRAAPLRKVRQQSANVTIGSFQASYVISGATTIANTGAVRNLLIDSQDIAPELKVIAAPRLDKRAYLYASFKLPDGTPFLRGTISLFRDNTYVGRGALPELAGGDRHELGFGADSLVKVTFAAQDEKRGESGIISSSKTDRRGFRFEMTNLHDQPIAYTILDRLPRSKNEDIQVERFGRTKPTRSDVDDKRGVVAWDGTLAAKEKAVVDFGYIITWPADKRIIYR